VARIRNLTDPNNPATPALAVVALGWLEPPSRTWPGGSRSQKLQVWLSVADRQGSHPSHDGPTATAGRRHRGMLASPALYPT